MTDTVTIRKGATSYSLLDPTTYLISRDKFTYSEAWDKVLTHLPGGGANIGRATLAEQTMQWELWIYGTGGSYQAALNNLNNLRGLLKNAHLYAQSGTPVQYSEQIQDQTAPTVWTVNHGEVKLVDRSTVQAGVIRTVLILSLKPLASF